MFQIKPLKKPAANAQPVKKHNAFAAAMDDDDKPASTQTHALQSKVPLIVNEMSKQSHRKMLEETTKYMIEDPNIYDYDNHFDEITTRRQEIAEQKKEKKESRYIDNIIRHSEKRKIERNIITEKLAEKELIREGLNSNTEKYVTKGYLKMQEQNKQFLEEDAAKEAYNQAHAASSEDNMAGLYQNLYKDNFLDARRPDLANVKKVEPVKAPVAVQTQEKSQTVTIAEEKGPSQDVHIRQEAQSVDRKKEDIEVSARKGSPERTGPREERKRGSRSKSRSRSREKSPLRMPTPKEEIKVEKQEIKEVSKEDKLKSAKERYLARKLNQNAAPAPENV